MTDYETNDMMFPYGVAPAAPNNNFLATPAPQGSALAASNEAAELAAIKGQVFMAKQYPRDIQASWEKILGECQRTTLAEKAVYSFPRGKETVTGPSIRLAEVLARNFGNIKFSYDVLERRGQRGSQPGVSVIRAWAWDLENNVMAERKFEVKHYRSTKSGGYNITDDRDIYELEANMASRRIRACILQIIPGDITDAAVNACRVTANSGIAAMMADKSQRAKLVAQMLRLYDKMGVTQDDLEGCLNCKVDDWTADHMLKLKEMKNSLDDNTTSLGDYFPRLAVVDNKDAVITKEQVTKLMEMAKATQYQGKVSAELKKMGIAKFADVPVNRYDEVVQMIEGFGVPSDGGNGGGAESAQAES